MKAKTNKRVLWVNPSFLDYRIPLYAEMLKECDGAFFLIYSKKRIPDRCHQRATKELGDNALFLKSEKPIDIGRKTEFANGWITIPFPKGLYKMICNVKPDLLIAEGFFQFTPWAVIYAFFHRKPLLIAYERTAHTERNCPLWRRLYRRFIGLFVSGYVVNGQLTKEYLMTQGVKGRNIFTGAMCADSAELTAKTTALQFEEIDKIRMSIFGEKPSGITYLFVGRMINRKGTDLLIKAWHKHILKHPEDLLLLVGDGPEQRNYEQLAANMPSIVFAGAIDYSEIHKYYAVSDVFVIPTLEDNWSLVVPEAMACGLPIACSIYNGCHPELVHFDVNGITFDPLDKSSIIEALEYFHHINLKTFGEASKKIENEYNPENTARNIIKAVKHYL